MSQGTRSVANEESLATQLRRSLDECLQRFERSEGISRDAYSPQETYHPMAEAEYLFALRDMVRVQLISDAQYQAKVGDAIRRLQESSVITERDTAAWGLGFAYGGAPPDEPYVITTALIARSLRGRDTQTVEPAEELHRRALTWLDEQAPRSAVGHRGREIQVPTFSPHTSLLVVNAAAMWAAALGDREDVRSDYEAVLDWVLDQYEEDVGWPYTPEGARVDLLHQCYILSAIGSARGFASVERRALGTVTSFIQGGYVPIDKFDFLSLDEAMSKIPSASSLWLRPKAASAFVFRPEPARPWSIGALLVTCADLERDGHYPGYWQVLGRRIAQEVTTGLDMEALTEKWGLRQLMHVAHGFAALLANLRSTKGIVGRRDRETDRGRQGGAD